MEYLTCDKAEDCECRGAGCKAKLSKKEEAEREIMTKLGSRFKLTEGTFFMKPEQINRFGLLGNKEDARRVLEGMFEGRDEILEAEEKILRVLQITDKIRERGTIEKGVSAEDFREGFRGAKERTASSFSTLHFGHYKTAVEDEELSDIHAGMLDIAARTGTSLLRWQKGPTVMIYKKQNSILVDNLRAILLMEADFNFLNKLIIGKRMMQNAEEAEEMPIENVGGRKGFSAAEAGLTWKMFFDVLRMLRQEGAVTSADAHTCYDRIQHTGAALSCEGWSAQHNSGHAAADATKNEVLRQDRARRVVNILQLRHRTPIPRGLSREWRSARILASGEQNPAEIHETVRNGRRIENSRHARSNVPSGPDVCG